MTGLQLWLPSCYFAYHDVSPRVTRNSEWADIYVGVSYPSLSTIYDIIYGKVYGLFIYIFTGISLTFHKIPEISRDSKRFQRFQGIPEIPQDFKIPSEISRFQLRFQKFCTRFLAVADPSVF